MRNSGINQSVCERTGRDDRQHRIKQSSSKVHELLFKPIYINIPNHPLKFLGTVEYPCDSQLRQGPPRPSHHSCARVLSADPVAEGRDRAPCGVGVPGAGDARESGGETDHDGVG